MNIRQATRQYETWLARHVRVVKSDLGTKHELMTQDAFSFLRGTFYRWMQLFPALCPKAASAPTLLAVGDLHVENYGTWRDAEAAEHPILLTVNEDNPNGAGVRFLVEGAGMPGNAAFYQRLVLLFDGEDPEAVETARARWGEAKSAGFDVTYWQADDRGGWQRQA